MEKVNIVNPQDVCRVRNACFQHAAANPLAFAFISRQWRKCPGDETTSFRPHCNRMTDLAECPRAGSTRYVRGYSNEYETNPFRLLAANVSPSIAGQKKIPIKTNGPMGISKVFCREAKRPAWITYADREPSRWNDNARCPCA